MKLTGVCSRRSLLKALGVGPALLPFLEAERARAACGGVAGPRRVFIVVWANGMFALNGGSWATIGDDFVLPSHMRSLEAHRQDLLLMDGFNYRFIADTPNDGNGEVSGHGCFQGMLTGMPYRSFGSSTANNVAGGPSIDQHIGNGLRARGYGGLVSLNLMVYSRSTARLSWQAAGTPVIPDADPFHVYLTLLAGPAGVLTPDRALAARKSVLDHVSKDLNRFVRKVGGAEDRANVEAHHENVRAIERRLAAQPTPVSTACRLPNLGPRIEVRRTENFEAVTKMQIDLAVMALAADATRVVVLQLGDQSNPDIVLTTLGFRPAGTGDSTGDANGLHAIAHRNGAEKIIVDTWFMEQIAYAIRALKDVSEGSAGTMFANTALVGMNNMRTGNSEYRNVPALLAGSCGGYFRTGRSLDLAGTPNNGLLIALANAAGVPTTTFGEASYGGELAVLRAP